MIEDSNSNFHTEMQYLSIPLKYNSNLIKPNLKKKERKEENQHLLNCS